MQSQFRPVGRRIYTITELTRTIKKLVEDALPFVWISGEISNFRMPQSGHYYFSLKDETAQLRAVMFRGHNLHLKFQPEDGMMVTGLGRIAVYEPQGVYQIILEHLEPAGAGALALAFEQLKQKLSAEGLFEESHKKQIPFLPGNISVITSSTGAVIHDIIRVISRRFPNVHIKLWPVKVQGEEAAEMIIHALEKANARGDSDLIIVARGGGSMEDLAAFNSEALARAVFASHIPVISAVGHETDYTICDFVADLRAPTPSAAAELAVPEKDRLTQRIDELENRLQTSLNSRIQNVSRHLSHLRMRLGDPQRAVRFLGQKQVNLRLRLEGLMRGAVSSRQEHLKELKHRLNNLNPMAYLLRVQSRLEVLSFQLTSLFQEKARERQTRLENLNQRLFRTGPTQAVQSLKSDLKVLNNNLARSCQAQVDLKAARLDRAVSRLAALSPQAVLERGYSITRKKSRTVVRNAGQVNPGRNVEVILGTGRLMCEVNISDPDFALASKTEKQTGEG